MNKQKYNFDEIIDRKLSNSIKWWESKDILPMWIADMDFKVADEILDAMKKTIDHGIIGYDDKPDSFYESIINWVKDRYNWEIKKEWLVFTPGVVPGLGISIKSFSKEGDKVIIQPPVYPPFYRVIENNNRRVVENSLIYKDNKYIMNIDDLEKNIDKDVKMAMICSPHNPVGRVWKKEELEVFGNLCLKNNIIMISDEIHCDLTFSDYKHIPLASISDEFANNTITFMAPSKTFNIAGLFASVAIIPNEKLRKLYNDTIENMEITHTNGFSIIGFEAAYKYGKNWLSQAIRYIEDNADFAVDYINKNIPEIKTYKPEGTFLMWLDFKPLGKTSEEINELLINKGKVQLNNGATFGTAGEGFFRLNIGCPREVLKEGLDRIKKAIQ
ncbi:cystathione beta-lyase [Tissierella praeacuta DSM 18095]|uniref:cysteine-S-conjugate beta-lyase n=1 Tax=Tissierella praeacuta DSM 18095 TaxID=1123404 RepID=A0A1M4WNG5_9FIRM|nr:MalY/PatB family protein [Tissierella praeacuta]SHE82512.1 cystathione beta-lyase [Tissierella praeacuta DSM 18095]SUO99256.1 Cystathionine beta-lyase PatB [Tissierella praeacuta]